MERYALGARTRPVQLVSILREPAAAFFSKYEYFGFRKTVGTIEETVVQRGHGNGQTRDFGFYTDEQLGQFLASGFGPMFILILEELALSLALFKLACGLAWGEVVVLQSNANPRRSRATRQFAGNRSRLALLEDNHRRDYALYNASLAKLLAARASYPDQAELEAAIARINATNQAADARCRGYNRNGFCSLLQSEEHQFSKYIDPATGFIEMWRPWGRGPAGGTVGKALEEISSFAGAFGPDLAQRGAQDAASAAGHRTKRAAR